MNNSTFLGIVLVAIGAILVVVGLVVMIAPKIPFLGKLPGDIIIRREGFTFYFPIVTSLLLSGVLTLIIWLAGKIAGR